MINKCILNEDTFMNDEDFEQFITLLDAAIASDDAKIQRALKKFVFLIRLNLSDDDCKPGPFTKMMETIDDLQRRLAAVEGTQQPTYYGGTSPFSGGTSVDPFIHWYNAGTGTSAGSLTNAVSTATIPATTITNATTSNITFTSGTTGTTASTGYATTNIFPAYEVDSGTKIKNEIKESLSKLVKAA